MYEGLRRENWLCLERLEKVPGLACWVLKDSQDFNGKGMKKVVQKKKKRKNDTEVRMKE